MRIGFFGGVREIGSNIILIEDKGEGIVFDFGNRFRSNNTFFNEYMSVREYKGTDDYVTMEEYPPFKNFYKKPLSPDKILNIDILGLFFSHAHLDHIGHIDVVNNEIPKYLTSESLAILKYFVKFGYISEMPENVKVISKRVNYKNFNITAVPVDHDIPGATSFFIKTPKGLVIYTGDLFFSGVNKEKTLNFIEKAKREHPYILITEGTRINWGGIKSLTEEEIQMEVKSISNTFNGMIIANPYEPHVPRIYSFFITSKELKKKFVLSLPYAFALYFLSEAGNQISKEILLDADTFIYAPVVKKDELFKRYSGKFIGAGDINKKQENIILLLGYKGLPELIDIKPKKGAVYIHSGGEPITSVDGENASILMNWISKFDLPFFKVHSPGHASEIEILNMAKEINPEILLPIHTQIPERFTYVSSNVRILEKGVIEEF